MSDAGTMYIHGDQCAEGYVWEGVLLWGRGRLSAFWGNVALCRGCQEEFKGQLIELSMGQAVLDTEGYGIWLHGGN